MKKNFLYKQGFTLIELLSVIILVAVISLIAVPIFLRVIEQSRQQSYQESLNMYVKAIHNAVSEYQLANNSLPNSINELNIEYTGAKIECDIIVLNEDGSVFVNKCSIDGKKVDFMAGKAKVYNNGEVVYFDVSIGHKCSEDDYFINNSLSGYDGINNSQTQSHCLKFYAFNDSDTSGTVNLILDHNTTHPIAWNTTQSNLTGPSTILEELKIDTDEWQGTEPLDNYKVMQSGYANYLINYTSYKARLITAQEVAEIVGLDWDQNTATTGFYLDSKTSTASETCTLNNTSNCNYGWLYDRTASNCTDYGCLNNSNIRYNSYWTATSKAGSNSLVWFVGKFGDLSFRNSEFYYNANRSLELGIRPVIEVSKEKLR